jgi:cytochrome b involved in lipid metabolism
MPPAGGPGVLAPTQLRPILIPKHTDKPTITEQQTIVCRTYSLAEVAAHASRESAWIAVNGKVYDITSFIHTHPGWDCACGISTVLAILRCLGTDCSDEFNSIHTRAAHRQLQAYLIGDLAA